MKNHDYGYYRFATICRDRIIFVCEDDLWEVTTHGGYAKRLTAGRGEFSMPRLSPDGSMVAFVAREEGHPEVFVMPSNGGIPKRLTYLGSGALYLSGWSHDGKQIYFTSDARAPFYREMDAYGISPEGGEATCFKWGHVDSFMIAGDGRVVLGRNAIDPARWKRYRGGTAGDLWIDPKGKGKFQRLIQLKGNLVSPMIIDNRIYFLSDHDGMGNIFSCRADGSDLRKHTHHMQYYVRFPSTDGKRIVYAAGADVYLFDPKSGSDKRIDVKTPVTTHQVQRKFVDGRDYLTHFSPHPDGHSVALIARGQPITMGNWEGAPIQHGKGSGVRYRNAEWLPDGKHFLVVNDKDEYERIELHTADQSEKPVFITSTDLGRVINLKVSPDGKKAAIGNHRQELIVLDLGTEKLKVVDRSPAARISDFNWAPDSRWIAYSFLPHPETSIIKIANIENNTVHNVTNEVRSDTAPVFDPDGKYLYFLGVREFYPVYDMVRFDYDFPKAEKPYLVTLRKDIPSPFVQEPKPIVTAKKKKMPLGQEENGKNGASKTETAKSIGVSEKSPAARALSSKALSAGIGKMGSRASKQALKKFYKDALDLAYKEMLKKVESEAAEKAKADKTAKTGRAKEKGQSKSGKDKEPGSAKVEIDFDGIEDRILAFPVSEGRYGQVIAAEGRALFTVYPVEGIKPSFNWWSEDVPLGTLMVYDFEEARAGALQKDVGPMVLAFDNQTLFYRTNHRRIRAVDALEKLGAEGREPSAPSGTGRKSGYIDLQRAQVLVSPQLEWKQMYEEAWRLQREQFWDERMSDIDWDFVHDRYEVLLPRVRTRSEVSDLIWEMQGELGTSHAYEFGGDYRWPPFYSLGFLGADFSFDLKRKGYKIERILKGDSWDPYVSSPLARPGLNLSDKDVIIAINGNPVDKETSIGQLMLNQSGREVRLKIIGADKKERTITVQALRYEHTLRYRDWVEKNRRYVHEKTGGKVGYIHIPDMGPSGFAEFHRGYLSEIKRDGLIVDVRYNGGGHVSPLLLEKLLRKRVGYDVSRWGPPQPYPPESVKGAIVTLTNQFAGSDGDIFSHCFKLYKLGPLVGKRTWGGVIGIWPRHRLVDGTITTQPEFSFWFTDVGWGVENYGTDPDYDVDIAPHEFHDDKDPQMDKALSLILKTTKDKPVKLPDFSKRPSLPVPEQLLSRALSKARAAKKKEIPLGTSKSGASRTSSAARKSGGRRTSAASKKGFGTGKTTSRKAKAQTSRVRRKSKRRQSSSTEQVTARKSTNKKRQIVTTRKSTEQSRNAVVRKKRPANRGKTGRRSK